MMLPSFRFYHNTTVVKNASDEDFHRKYQQNIIFLRLTYIYRLDCCAAYYKGVRN
jgi:hypothetical protein